MGGTLSKIGKSLSKAVKNIGKSVSKAAPVLIPLAVAAVTGGMGSGGWLGKIAKPTLGGSNLGTIGKSLLSGLTKGGIVKNIVDPASTSGTGKDSDNLLVNLTKKAAPALITRAIDGKPKTAQQEAQAIMQAMPQSATDPEAVKALTGLISDSVKNPQKITPKSGGYNATPMTYGQQIQFAPADNSGTQNPSTPAPATNNISSIQYTNPMAPVAMVDFMTGGDIGQLAAPVTRKPRGYAIRG